MKSDKIWKKASYTIRIAEKKDAEMYYEHNFNPLDVQCARFTGCKSSFTKEEVMQFFHSCLEAEDRYDFMILDETKQIIGECVISEIDEKLKKASYRIALFHPEHFGKGIGSWATCCMRDFAFEELKLHRLELEVYAFNPRAEKTYAKAGFKREGILKDAIMDGEQYADVILMAILEDEWKELK